MKKNQLIIFLICFIYLFVSYSPLLAITQGKEYQRARAVTFLPGKEPFIEEEPFPEYYLAVGDTIKIFVWQNPDLSGTATIMPNGKVSFPLIGILKAAGLTIEELQDKVKGKLSKYVKFPEVTVSVEEFAGNKVYLFGEVGNVGIYLYTGTLTLFELMAMAGGIAVTGKRESVIIVSGNLTPKPEVRRVNLFRALRKGTSDKDFIIRPNDVVYVPRTFIADVNRFLEDMEPAYDKAMAVFDWRDKIRKWYRHIPPSGGTISVD